MTRRVQKILGLLEPILAAVTLAALGGVVWRLFAQGYLPQPFYFHVDETLMDLYSTAYWANNGAAYLTWHSLYPPLSFVFLDIFSIHKCYVQSPALGRQCDWRSLVAIISCFGLNCWLVFNSYRKSSISASTSRTIAVCLGLPMLYALERGNLLIPCFTCFVLGFSDLLKAGWRRWLAMALAINFKPYLVFSAVPYLARRDLRWVVGSALLFVAIYGATFVLEGSGSPMEVIANEARYAIGQTDRYFTDLYYATSYWPLIRLLRAAPTGLRLVDPVAGQAISLGLEILIRAAQLGAAGCLAAALFRPAAVDVRRFGALLTATALTAFTTGSAGYAQIFLFFLIFFEPWRGGLRIVILVAAYLLCLPIDHAFLPVINGAAHSYLGGRLVTAHFGVSIGQLLRPGILLVIQFGLIALNLRDSLGARIREDGLGAPGDVSSVAGATANR